MKFKMSAGVLGMEMCWASSMQFRVSFQNHLKSKKKIIKHIQMQFTVIANNYFQQK